jgi:hypothetical protein
MGNFSSDFIIRIYRFGRRNSRRFIGTAERVGGKGKRAFSTLEELWDILTKTKPKKESNGPTL